MPITKTHLIATRHRWLCPFRQALNLMNTTAGAFLWRFSIPHLGLTVGDFLYILLGRAAGLAGAAKHRNFLHAYADEQRADGRFQWPANVGLHDQEDWLNHQHVVPAEARTSFVVALGLWFVPSIPLVFTSSRDSCVAPAILECGAHREAFEVRDTSSSDWLAVVGLMGGLLGAVLTLCFVNSLGLVFPVDVARLAHITLSTLLQASIVALCMVVLAAAYPIARLSDRAGLAFKVEPDTWYRFPYDRYSHPWFATKSASSSWRPGRVDSLAIVANVIFIITQRIALILQPSGIDEANIVIVDNRLAGPQHWKRRTRAQTRTLRRCSLPGVVDAHKDYSYPIAGPWPTSRL